VSGKSAPYFRRLSWASASFAIMADIAMGSLGGSLKMKEKITGRFADILSWMYMLTATLRRYEADGRRPEDWPFVQYIMDHGFSAIQEAFDGIFANMRVPGLTWLFRGPIRYWSRLNAMASGVKDSTSHKVASAIQVPGDQRDRLTQGIFLNARDDEGLGRLERAFLVAKHAEDIERKIKKAIRNRQLPKKHIRFLLDEAKEKNVITQAEFDNLKLSVELRNDAIQVDSFALDEYKKR
jgi:acyl-CoA dehydrogenase